MNQLEIRIKQLEAELEDEKKRSSRLRTALWKITAIMLRVEDELPKSKSTLTWETGELK